ncbi:hypothetical protein IWQ61_005526 [Dispira simplex]|nr:hypothetical protein IWQ61_005526 [Dispira simplex]
MDGWYNTYEVVTVVISAVSVACGAAVVALALVLYRIRPQLRQVPSIYISLYIGLADALYRLSALLNTLPGFMVYIRGNEVLMRIFFWMVYFSPLWFIFLTMMISTDLQLTFLHPTVDREPIQRWYLTVATVLPFMISLPALCVPHIRWLSDPSRFGYSFGTSLNNRLFILFCYDLWIALGIFHCLVIVVLVMVKLLKGIHYIETIHLSSRSPSSPMISGTASSPPSAVTFPDFRPTTHHNHNSNHNHYQSFLSHHSIQSPHYPSCPRTTCTMESYRSSGLIPTTPTTPSHSFPSHTTPPNPYPSGRPAQLVRKLRQSVVRIMLYPIVPMVSQTLQMASLRIPIDEYRPLHLLATILCSSQGILNFIVFLLNPVVVEVISSWWAQRADRKRESELTTSKHFCI